MAGTRSSTRESGSSPSSAAGSKRKAGEDASPQSKRQTPLKKQQKTLEETLPDSDIKESAEKIEEQQQNGPADAQNGDVAKTNGAKQDEVNGNKSTSKNDPSDGKNDSMDDKIEDDHKKIASTKLDDTGKIETQDAKQNSAGNIEEGGAVEVSEDRKDAAPSNILEKGILYFFSRGRVGVDHPEGVQDIARSYLVLRPFPPGAKLGEGTLPDSNNNRLFALPKKVLPKSHRDVFMTFVEKAGVTLVSIKEEMAGSEYSTKTTGTRQAPAMTPIAEGVYAITSTGRESHLAYILTLPEELGEVQEEIGLRAKGSFVLSVKNPEHAGPANTNLPQGPGFSKDILEEFRGLRWAPLQPKHLDYANAQFLLIGEASGELGKAVEPTAKDQKHEKETPLEEMEKLEEEDGHRVEALKGNDAVFDDLGISHKEYPKMKTSW